jgi:hypothetical protein
MKRVNWIGSLTLLPVLLAAGCPAAKEESAAEAAGASAAAAPDTSGGSNPLLGAKAAPAGESYLTRWIGKTAAGFVLPGIDGKPVDVGQVLGTKPVVLVFYRGVW